MLCNGLYKDQGASCALRTCTGDMALYCDYTIRNEICVVKIHCGYAMRTHQGGYYMDLAVKINLLPRFIIYIDLSKTRSYYFSI